MNKLQIVLAIASICLVSVKSEGDTISLTLENSSFLLLGSKIIFRASLSSNGVALPLREEKTYHYLFGDYFGKLLEKQYSVLYTLDTKQTKISQFGQFTGMAIKEGLISFSKGPTLSAVCPGQQPKIDIPYFHFINSYFLLHLVVECVDGKTEVKDASIQSEVNTSLDNGIKVDHKPIEGATQVKSMV